MVTTGQAASTASIPPRTSHRAVTVVMCVALAAVVAAMSSVNVALPGIARSTHATQTQLEWVIDAYSLVFAALLLAAGAIGDRFGRRRALIAGLTVFGTGSALAMTAHSATELIALRAVLGLGAALVMPATLSTITGTFPPAQRTRAVSVWAAVAGGSAVLGLLCSGILLEFWSWRSVFALNVVLAVAAIAGTVRAVPDSADRNAAHLDLVGAVIAVIGMVAPVFSVVEAPDYGWASARTLIGIAVGLVVLAGFVFWELTRSAPLLDPRIFRHGRLAAGTLSIFVQFFAFFGFIFVVLQYLQLVRGDTAIVSAVSMLPMAAAMMPTARLAPRLVALFGARAVCAAGLAFVSASLVVLAQMNAHSGYGWLIAGLVPLGIGMGAAMTPATTAITEALPASQQGVGSAVNDLARELGGAVGIAVIGSALTATYRSHLSLPGLPAAAASKARDSLAAAAHLGRSVASQASTSFTDGLQVALLVGASSALLAAVVIALLLRRDCPTARSGHQQGRRIAQLSAWGRGAAASLGRRSA
jgi:EmrB/QacA subfamily drug resistance transporter